jgi:hypothetical protein
MLIAQAINSVTTEKQNMRRSERTSFDPPMEADWHRMISEAAYLHAEKRGFAPGHALDDWLLAEQEVKAQLESP